MHSYLQFNENKINLRNAKFLNFWPPPHEKRGLALLITFCGPQFRHQENFTLGLRKEVFLQLDDYQKQILGFKVWNGYGRTGNPTDIFLNFNNTEIGELKI